jgi:ABC-type transport system substrate-binding protein
MTTSISRRGMIGAPILLAGCRKRSEYFGNSAAPARRVLKFALGPEPDGLDPAGFSGGFEQYILPSLFEGLISYDPHTVEPIAGLATHYEINRDDTKLIFFLRGHPNPRGIRLPRGTQREAVAAPLSDRNPARWTDGALITAHDFVYSWRRVIDPASGAAFAYVLYYVRNGVVDSKGTEAAAELGVRALTISLSSGTGSPESSVSQTDRQHRAGRRARQAVERLRGAALRQVGSNRKHVERRFPAEGGRPYERLM